MSRLIRSDRGQWQVPLIFILIFGAGTALLIDTAKQSVGREVQEVPRQPVAYGKVVDHGPPRAAFERECVFRVASRFGLSWSDETGWKAADYKQATLSGRTTPADIQRDQKIVTEWENDTRARVNLAASDWAHCLKGGEPETPGPPVTEKDPRDAIAGTWYLRRDTADPYAGTPDSCVLPATVTITFRSSANIATVTFAGKQPEEAEGVGPGQFEHEEGNTQNGLRFEIGLIVYDRQDAVSGQIHDQPGSYLCTTGFTGLRQPWPNSGG